ncbi:uncharacterized protein LOC142511450 [Primulina tabacum]|uniref:uncharacterized protein LOC142511450 n=1 Tax=Primulina tabacum TaxID=48773 RepID=UPI003F5AAC59
MRSNPRSEPRRRGEPEPERKKNSPPATGLIKMISGGSTDGDSNRARKSRSRRECMEVEGIRRNEAIISFGREDLRGSFHLEAVETALFGFAGHAWTPHLRIISMPIMNELKTVASTYHQKIKFPVGDRVGEVRGDQPSSRKCYVEAVRADQSKTKGEGKKARVNEVEERVVEKGEVHFVAEEEQEIIEIRPELTGISPLILEHQLNILPGSHPVKQKKRLFGPGKDKVISEQVKELLKAGHIREIQFPTWLSNVILGYHQILLAKSDQDKASFITSGVYVDDILGKSKEVADFIVDLEETFATLMHYEIKLNPAKYQGIEVNQEKVKSVLSMPSPRSVKEVQKLTGKIASLSRFISRSAHRSYPFFRVLRKAQQFGLDEKCEQAFQDLKIHLAELPMLHAVSSVLIKEEGSDQKPVYYVSHALRGLELRYSEIEKVALALIMTARKLRPYFLSHQIIVLNNSPLGRIMTHSEVSGRMIKWTVELGEYGIEYKPRVAIKAQALSYFLSEMVQPEEEEVWRVFVDGASSLAGCGVGVVIISLPGERMKLALRIDSRVTNNEAEYETVLAGIRAAREVGASRIIMYSDSQLTTQQIKGVYEANDDRMLKYLQLIKAHAEGFADWSIEQIPREENGEADDLAKMAASLTGVSTREFGVPRKLILENGRQFQGKGITSWCREMKITQYFTSVAYPQANGQTEVVNIIIVQALKTRLQDKGKDWVEELPSVLWAYRTTPWAPTQETPCYLVYGSEAVLPVEIGQTSSRVESYPDNNDQARAMELDLVEEKRDRAFIRMEAYRSRVMKSYNKKVRIRDFQVGDLVMKKVNPTRGCWEAGSTVGRTL